MPNYLSPGVFVEERSAGERSISTVSPSALGIIGFSLRGANDKAIVFDSYDEFERKAGGLIVASDTAYQVRSFFDNGGAHGWFSRAIYASTAAKASFLVSTVLATSATITGYTVHAGGAVVISGGNTNMKIVIDTINSYDNINVTAGAGNGTYTIQTICNNINTALVAFNALYGSVATVVDLGGGNKAIKLTSPTKGTGSKIEAANATANDGLVSIYGAGDNATGTGSSGNTFTLRAQYVGEDGNNLSFIISDNPNDTTGHIYDLSILYKDEVVEYYEAVSFHYDDRELPIYYKTQLENSSQWVEVVAGGTSGLLIPVTGVPETNLASGREDISNGVTVADFDKGAALISALDNFDNVKEILNLICPDAENLGTSDCKAVQNACAIYHGDTNRANDVFFIAGTPVSLDDSADMTSVTNYNLLSPVSTDSYTAMYFPPVKIFDTLRRKNRRVSVSGLVAGIYARTDSTRNVGKAPGGVNDGALLGISSVYRILTKGQRDTLYQSRVNPIISSPETGQAVWGVRSTSIDAEWRYINARRLFMFCERSVYSAMQFSVFENNGPRLWLILRTTIGAFLQSLFVDGYFAGATETDAYYVICDDTNNPTSQINAGMVTVDVGIAVNKPSEYVRIRFQQKVKQA